MLPFQTFYERAVQRHGEDTLREHFPTLQPPGVLAALGDDRYLSAMSKRVFAAGFRWKVIQVKWPGFEEAFHRFDVAHVANLEAEGIGALAQDTRIVRNRPKIVSTVENARLAPRVSRVWRRVRGVVHSPVVASVRAGRHAVAGVARRSGPVPDLEG